MGTDETRIPRFARNDKRQLEMKSATRHIEVHDLKFTTT